MSSEKQLRQVGHSLIRWSTYTGDPERFLIFALILTGDVRASKKLFDHHIYQPLRDHDHLHNFLAVDEALNLGISQGNGPQLVF